jgi:hypothetical protein
MKNELCIVNITKVDFSPNEKEGTGGETITRDPIVYAVKPMAIKQLEAYLKRLESDGLALKATDEQI